ncbi:MAG: RICIN domain-containing protein [Streptomycetaceae bacterium]|nr:RICIN domain-containing protein [Streptomycetaceae bacterium]
MSEFLAMVRELKERSELTLRALEERAAARGEVLARSTVADMLRKDTLPRSELLATYLRACGVDDLEPWLRARERLATGGRVVVATPPAPPRRPPWRRPPVVVAAVVALAVVVLVVAAVVLWPEERDHPDAPDPTAVGTSQRDPAPDEKDRVTLHAVDAPDLCLTEGRDSTGAYPTEVAALRPCADPGPRVYLEPVRAFATIKWDHPKHGPGCLTVMHSGTGQDLLEPRNDCAEDNLDQLFRVERVHDETYRFVSLADGWCVGLRGGVAREGAEAVREPCGEETDQQFTVDRSLAPPGG